MVSVTKAPQYFFRSVCLCFHALCGLSSPSGCPGQGRKQCSSVSPAAIAILSKWEESIVAVLVNVGKRGLVCGWCQCHVAQDCLPGLPPGLE